MTLLIALCFGLARASERVENYDGILRSLNYLFYAADRGVRERNELDLHRHLPAVAEFYGRLELPELAYYWQNRALASAEVAAKNGVVTHETVRQLDRRARDFRRETYGLLQRREELGAVDLSRVVQLYLSVNNKISDLGADGDPRVIPDKLRRGFERDLLRLAEPYDDATIAALFAAVTNVDYDPELRLTAFGLLARTNHPALLPMLTHFALDRDSSTPFARAALTALDQYSDRRLVQPLGRVLENSRAPSWARQLAAERLGNFDEHHARTLLENVAWRELGGDWPLGLKALQSLERVGNLATLERLRERFHLGFEGPRRTDAVKASLIALADRLKVDCGRLLDKKN